MPTSAPFSLRRPTRLQLAGAVVVLLGLTALGVRACVPGGAVQSSQREMRDLHVGDCLKILPRGDHGRGAAGGMNITHEKVACESAGVVTYVVGGIGHGEIACPNANYQTYWEDDDTDKANPRRWTACLVPNLQAGRCYEPDPLTRAYAVTSCSAHPLFKVETIAEVDDARRCTGATEPFNFPMPARTYCVTNLS